ncbi:hypothetical protein C8R43DRAFT_549468 [Mycena crocata]|nr:hypothetical protein C8R43DRAFT_549468 [Mycena crocata]
MFPLRTSKPQFDERKPSSLRRYFEDVEELCRLNYDNPTSKQKIERALYYTPDPSTEDLWRSVVVGDMSWDSFIAQVMHLYPGRDGGFHHSDLARFVERSSRGTFTSVADVGHYHREFTKIANRLIADEKINDNEANWKYMAGIPKNLLAELSLFCAPDSRYSLDTRKNVYEATLKYIDLKNGHGF